MLPLVSMVNRPCLSSACLGTADETEMCKICICPLLCNQSLIQVITREHSLAGNHVLPILSIGYSCCLSLFKSWPFAMCTIFLYVHLQKYHTVS